MGNYKNNKDFNDQDIFCKDCRGKDQKDCVNCQRKIPKSVVNKRYYGGHIDSHGKYRYNHEGD